MLRSSSVSLLQPLNVKPSHAQILIGNQEATGSPSAFHFNRMSSKHLKASSTQSTTGNHQRTISIAPWWLPPPHRPEGSSIFPFASSSSLPAADRCALAPLHSPSAPVHVDTAQIIREQASGVECVCGWSAAANAQCACTKGGRDVQASAAR